MRDLIAIIPHRNAAPDEAQASSTRVAGAGSIPAQLADMGAVCD